MKKTLVILAALLMMLGISLGLASCGECTHESITSVTTDPTCTEWGYTTHTCNECGYNYVDSYTEVLHHVISEWIVDAEATCSAKGAKHTACTRCNEVLERREIDKDASAHNVVTDLGVEPTENADGLTEGSHCSLCNEVLVAQEVIPMLVGRLEIKSDTLTVNGNTIYGNVSNGTGVFSFAENITVHSDAEFVVSRDISCENPILSKTVSLDIGDNAFYILVTNGRDTKLYSVTVRRLPTYTVSFNACGGTPMASQVVEEGSFATVPETYRAGYTVVGWSFDLAQPITGDIVVDAIWHPNGDTPYKVEFYYENVDKIGYDLAGSETLTGTTDAFGEAIIRDIEHFEYNSAISITGGIIEGDGSLVLKLYYTRNSYTVGVSVNNEKAGSANGSGTYNYDKEITLTATSNPGYIFLGWYVGYNIVSTERVYTFNVDRSESYVAKWQAIETTPYKVECYLENEAKNGYDLATTSNLQGTTDTIVTVTAEEIPHFTYNATMSTVEGNVNGDGSLVLKLYYTRHSYTVSVSKNNENAGNVTGGGIFAYNKSVTVSATTNRGYNFVGWYIDDTLITTESTYTFKADKNVTYTAKWQSNPVSTYRVEYYLENVNKNGYSLVDATDYQAATDSTVKAEIRSFDHFTFNSSKSITSGVVTGDGALVLKVYYTRHTYTVSTPNSYENYGSISGAGTYAYNKEVRLTASVTRLGYSFLGWYSDGVLVSESKTVTLNIDKNIEARFSVSPEMEVFDFTSTASTCTVNSIKDKTVKEIIVPDYVTVIEEGAFSGCEALESITLPFVGRSEKTASDSYQYPFGYVFGTIRYGNLNSTTQDYYGKDTESVTQTPYYIPASLKNVVITGGNILYGAFSKCAGLVSVTLPEGITSIERMAFVDCSGIATITIPNSVETIGESAFYRCVKMTELTIGNGVTSIGNNAFYNCTSITTLVIPDSVITIGDSAFMQCASLTTVKMGENITTIGASAFSTCKLLAEISLGNKVSSIGDYAFSACEKLASVTMGSGISSIGKMAFQNCVLLSTIKYRGTEAQWNNITKGGLWDYQAGKNTPAIKYSVIYNYTGI